ncbi:MAG: hypothetical protein GWP91_17965 [Rhodobacterales bacterium]|nr:hypothetical protein [Rhodobacterales bacterium]
MARLFYEEGMALEASGDLSGAAIRYRSVRRIEPAWLDAVVDLGRVLVELERYEEAEGAYQTAPNEFDSILALGQLYLLTERPDLAYQAFGRLRQRDHGNATPLLWEARALVADDQPAAAAEVLLEYLDRPTAELDDPGVLKVGLDAAKALHLDEQPAPAAALLDMLQAHLTLDAMDADAMAQISALKEELRMLERAQKLATAADLPLTPEQGSRLQAAREGLAQNDASMAIQTLESLLREAPRSAVSWATLSDARLMQGDIPEAERAIRRAEALSPTNPDYSERLGDLLMNHYGGRFAKLGAAAYGRALLWPRASASLLYRKALAEQELREYSMAAASVQTYLERAPEGQHAAEARQLMVDLAREQPLWEQVDVEVERPTMLSQEAWDAIHLAQAYQMEPDHVRALDELRVTRDLAPEYVPAINLEAELNLQLGRDSEAFALYQRSLEISPSQAVVKVVLANLWAERGDGAQSLTLLREAAEAGSGDAHLQLAQRWERSPRHWWAARDHLDAYFAAESGGEDYAAAQILAGELDQRIMSVWAVTVFFVLALPLIPTFRWAWRRGGKPLSVLVDKAPSVWPEIARIASALRHEVLKHNTTVLPAVADALDIDDTGPAAWAAERLFGEGGAVAHFRQYIQEIEVLGRMHGVRLDLRRSDPVFGPLILAMDQLAHTQSDLEQGRPRVATELRRLAERLNGDSYRDLGVLIRQACVMTLEPSLIQSVWQRVCTELHCAELPLTFVVPDQRMMVRIYPRQLEDILTNVMRNALEASLENGAFQVRIGVRVCCEEDEITGLERVVMRVQDDAPRRISTAMIRGRYIDRGLGLAVDLISRNGGSVHVEDESGWSKAVVVRLPRAEAPELENR